MVLQPDSAQWPSSLKSLTPAPDAFLSALGTTRAQAGSFAAQRTIDYDLNVALAWTAKDTGVKTYLLVSSAAVSAKSRMPYSKMKGELEDAVKAIDFPHTIILKPGLLVGARQDSRPIETVLRTVANGLGLINKSWFKDTWAIDADAVGRAAVAAALECSEGKPIVKYPRKDSQDKDSINTEATEYSKSGTDDASARHEDTAFNPDVTDPGDQKDKVGDKTGASNNPLEVSPANHDISKPRDDMEGGAENSSASSGSASGRERTSGGGSPKKGSKVA
ncbi:MAG: hypothetical protein Q9170_007502 [Blastenia crenularia]